MQQQRAKWTQTLLICQLSLIQTGGRKQKEFGRAFCEFRGARYAGLSQLPVKSIQPYYVLSKTGWQCL